MYVTTVIIYYLLKTNVNNKITNKKCYGLLTIRYLIASINIYLYGVLFCYYFLEIARLKDALSMNGSGAQN